MTAPVADGIDVELNSLRPTQMTVGFLLVKEKRAALREAEGRPQRLLRFILENPIRVVKGPKSRHYVIDHHHFALALLREGFRDAPMTVVADLSAHAGPQFWHAMEHRKFVRPVDARGRLRAITDLPRDLEDLADDPYRSLAGLVRKGGGFQKTDLPYMEFQWADYFRAHIPAKLITRDTAAAVRKAIRLAHAPEASKLPGYADGTHAMRDPKPGST